MEPTEQDPHDGDPRPSRLNPTIVAAGIAFGVTLAGLGVAAAQSDTGSDTTTTTEVAAQGPGTTAPESAPSTGAAPSTEATPPSTGATPAPAERPRARADRPAETPLTGDTAERVRVAALAAVPGGTVLRVETDSDGSPYEAHVRRADGTEVVVKVDSSFAVTSVEEATGATTGPVVGRASRR